MLDDGRMILIEDEISSALHIFDISDTGEFIEDRNMSLNLMRAFNTQLNDLEAVTMGPDGYIYAITSHQRNSKKERMANRELLIRFKIERNRITSPAIYRGLYDAIAKSNILGQSNEQGSSDIYNMNIEAIAFDKNKQLMLGFRSPLKDEKVIFAIVTNPSAIFEANEQAIISPNPLMLDTHGGGIRAISYDKKLNGYLITNEIVGISNKKLYSQILFWDGDPSHRVYHMNKLNMRNIEGITTVKYGDKTAVLVVSDNGDKIKGTYAEYKLLEYKEFAE